MAIKKSSSKRKVTFIGIVEKGVIPPKVLTLVVYLVVLMNFILGIVIYQQYGEYNLSHKIQSLLVGSYFFVFYILFLLGSLFYFFRIKPIYKKKEVQILSWALIIGLTIGVIVSYQVIGLSDTMQWAIPTFVTLVLVYILGKSKLKQSII